MKPTKYTFNFKGGPITVWAMNLEEAKICAQAEAIRNGWDYHIGGQKKISIVLTPIDNALMFICELTDTDTLDEQLACIEALKKLRNKLKDKENTK